MEWYNNYHHTIVKASLNCNIDIKDIYITKTIIKMQICNLE